MFNDNFWPPSGIFFVLDLRKRSTWLFKNLINYSLLCGFFLDCSFTYLLPILCFEDANLNFAGSFFPCGFYFYFLLFNSRERMKHNIIFCCQDIRYLIQIQIGKLLLLLIPPVHEPYTCDCTLELCLSSAQNVAATTTPSMILLYDSCMCPPCYNLWQYKGNFQ